MGKRLYLGRLFNKANGISNTFFLIAFYVIYSKALTHRLSFCGAKTGGVVICLPISGNASQARVCEI